MVAHSKIEAFVRRKPKRARKRSMDGLLREEDLSLEEGDLEDAWLTLELRLHRRGRAIGAAVPNAAVAPDSAVNLPYVMLPKTTHRGADTMDVGFVHGAADLCVQTPEFAAIVAQLSSEVDNS